MSNFLVAFFLTLLLSSCSTTSIYKNKLNTSETNPNPISIINKLSYKKILTEHQVLSLKNLIKNDPTLIKLLTPYQVLNLLGTPRVIKNQVSLEIWQYKDQCVLNIVWEKSNKGDLLHKSFINSNLNYNKLNFKITWLDSSNIHKQKLSPESCFCKLANIV